MKKSASAAGGMSLANLETADAGKHAETQLFAGSINVRQQNRTPASRFTMAIGHSFRLDGADAKQNPRPPYR